MKFTLSIGFCGVEQYLPLAQAADAAGWDNVCVPDGLFWYEDLEQPYPYSETGERFWSGQTPFLDPFAAIAAMGAVTRRVSFFPNVLKLPVRHPLLVAKAATSAAALCGGRFALGVGLSPWQDDFKVLGETWGDRGPRSAEMVDIIRGISKGGSYSHKGRFYTVPPMEIAPAADFPVYFGGLVDAVLKRAANHGDGYIWWENAKSSLDDLPGLLARLRGHLKAAGREAAPFEIKALPSSVGIEPLKRLAGLGVTDLVVMPWYFYLGDYEDPGFRLDCVKRFADEIMPQFR
jgi:alkanesulfonate monooxygenase SsuD/methylene tetrahydromethanopterin reductase-like flavin-dependent oxidoreductase (luciferase family)